MSNSSFSKRRGGKKARFAFAASSTFTRIDTVLWECAIGSWRARCATFQVFHSPCLVLYHCIFSCFKRLYCSFQNHGQGHGWMPQVLTRRHTTCLWNFTRVPTCHANADVKQYILNQWRKDKCISKCIPVASACTHSQLRMCKYSERTNIKCNFISASKGARKKKKTFQRNSYSFFPPCFRSTSLTSPDQSL